MDPLSSYARAPYLSLGAGALSGIPTSATLRIRKSLSPYLVQTSKEAFTVAPLCQPTAAQNATELDGISYRISQSSQALQRKVLLEQRSFEMATVWPKMGPGILKGARPKDAHQGYQDHSTRSFHSSDHHEVRSDLKRPIRTIFRFKHIGTRKRVSIRLRKVPMSLLGMRTLGEDRLTVRSP
jgi:hypothetical protein